MTSKVFSDGKKYFIEKKVICDICQKEINEEALFLVNQWTSKGEHIQTKFHFFCRDKFVKHPICKMQIRSVVRVVEERPVGSWLVIFRPPAIAKGRSDMTTDFVELASRPSEYVEDKTIHSFSGESIEGACIGNQNILEEIDMWNKEIEQNPIAFLEEQKVLSKKVALEHKKTNLLEGGSQ